MILEKASGGNGVATADLKKALKTADRRVSTVSRDKNAWRLVRAQLHIAIAGREEQDARLPQALDHIKEALTDVTESDDLTTYLNALITQGRLLLKHGIYEEALEVFSKASPLTIKTSDAAAQGVVEGNIATINFNLRHFEDSIVWFQRAAETFERADNARNQAFSLRGVGMCRSKQGKYDEALRWYDKALSVVDGDEGALRERVSIQESRGVDHLNIGDATNKQRPFKEALKNFHACLDIATEHDLKIPKAVALRNIGRTYAEERFNGRDLNEAKINFEASLGIVVKAGVQQLELEVRRELASILEQMGDFEHALKMYREFYEMERRLISEQAEEQTRAIEVRYAVEKNEAALKHEQEIRKRVASELESEREHLRSLTVSIEMKNAALRDTSKDLNDLASDLTSSQAKRVRRISKLAEMAATQTEQFGDLEENLAHVHTRTIDAIAREHKKLSATELKVCALLLQDLSSKEIAGLIDVEVSSVGKYRQRIRKKLGLQEGDNLVTYLKSFTVDDELSSS